MKKGRSLVTASFPFQLCDESETYCFKSNLIHDTECGKTVCSYCARFITLEADKPCEKKCSAKYCSEQCKARDISFRGHLIHCSGISYSHSKALHLYSLKAPHHMKECVQLAIGFLSCLLCTSSRYLQYPRSPCSWGEAMVSRLEQLGGRSTEVLFSPADREVAEESWVLLLTVLQFEKLPAVIFPLPSLGSDAPELQEEDEWRRVVRDTVSLERWTALLWCVGQRSVQAVAEHPTAAAARDLPQLPTATERLQVLVFIASSFNMLMMDDDPCSLAESAPPATLPRTPQVWTQPT